MEVDFKQSVVGVNDPSNRAITGRLESKTIQAKYFTTSGNASWMGGRSLQISAFPIAVIQFQANRKLFKYQPGDKFKLIIEEYGVQEMVCMVTTISVVDDSMDVIDVSAIEDIYSVSGSALVTYYPTTGIIKKPKYDTDVLNNIYVCEAPYVLMSDGSIGVVTVASRENRLETGYQIWISYDMGVSYSNTGITGKFAIHGTLVDSYSADTHTIDRDGFKVLFDNLDVGLIENLTDTDLYLNKNIALINDELVSFQSIAPVDGEDGQYQLSTVIRNLFDTQRSDHSEGDDFFFLGVNGFTAISSLDLTVGSTYYFKFLPFNNKKVGSLSEANPIALTITGRARTPYFPSNFSANGMSYWPTYTDDIVLAWGPRVRGLGAGIGNASVVTPGSVTHEGYFRVDIYIDGTLKRSTDSIDAVTWTYTEAMQISDNGSLGDIVQINLYNYDVDDLGITYCCAVGTLYVHKLS